MDVVIRAMDEECALHGLWMESGDRAQARDIPALSRRYYQLAGRTEGTVLPFYVLSQGYDPRAGTFSLFIGSEEWYEGLDTFMLPKGVYGCMEVRPKLGFLWGSAIGAAKQFFYAKWLPASPYAARNMEYERHDARSTGKNARIVLWFAIENKLQSDA